MKRCILYGLGLTALMLASCGSVNTVSTRTTAPDDSVQPLREQINDVLSSFFIKCTDVRVFPSKGGPLQAQVDVANDDFRYRGFAYKFTWLDDRGNVIPTQASTWKAASVPSGASTTLTSVAPNDSATDFTIQVRRSN